jgi:hypothetical protein
LQEDSVTLNGNEATLYTRYFSLRCGQNEVSQDLQKREVWLLPGLSSTHDVLVHGLPQLVLLHYYYKKTEYRLLCHGLCVPNAELQKRVHCATAEQKLKRSKKNENPSGQLSSAVSEVQDQALDVKSMLAVVADSVVTQQVASDWSPDTTTSRLDSLEADLAGSETTLDQEADLFVDGVWADSVTDSIRK